MKNKAPGKNFTHLQNLLSPARIPLQCKESFLSHGELSAVQRGGKISPAPLSGFCAPVLSH
jgi:hypothetical protein